MFCILWDVCVLSFIYWSRVIRHWYSIVRLVIGQTHGKTNIMTVRPAKTQISLGIRPVWAESSLSAWRKLGSLATYGAHSEDSDQTRRVPRLNWVFAGRTCHFVGFVMSRLIWKRQRHCFESNCVMACVMCVTSEGSSWTVQKRRLSWVLSMSLCDK